MNINGINIIHIQLTIFMKYLNKLNDFELKITELQIREEMEIFVDDYKS